MARKIAVAKRFAEAIMSEEPIKTRKFKPPTFTDILASIEQTSQPGFIDLSDDPATEKLESLDNRRSLD